MVYKCVYYFDTYLGLHVAQRYVYVDQTLYVCVWGGGEEGGRGDAYECLCVYVCVCVCLGGCYTLIALYVPCRMFFTWYLSTLLANFSLSLS
jgi:hypothetical protein